MKTKILLVGPLPDPISGVSLANKVVKELLDNSTKYEIEAINTSYPYFEEYVGSFSVKKLLFFIKLNFKSFKIFKSDIVYMTPGQTFFGITKYAIFILLANILKKERIIHVHGNHLGNCYKSLSGIKRRMFFGLVSSFTKGIVLSKSLRDNLTPFLEEKDIYDLPNFAENYLQEEKPIAEKNGLYIVFLSNLMLEKGILILLDALKELEKNNIFYKAKLAGNIDASLKEEIFEKINSLANTEYLGVVRGDSKRELLQWSNVFVLPTFYTMEGQPISILEALATKNLIVTTKHAGIPDVIEGNVNGFFVEKKDTNSLFKVLKELSNEFQKVNIIAEGNFHYFNNNFTIEKFEDRLLKILDE